MTTDEEKNPFCNIKLKKVLSIEEIKAQKRANEEKLIQEKNERIQNLQKQKKDLENQNNELSSQYEFMIEEIHKEQKKEEKPFQIEKYHKIHEIDLKYDAVINDLQRGLLLNGTQLEDEIPVIKNLKTSIQRLSYIIPSKYPQDISYQRNKNEFTFEELLEKMNMLEEALKYARYANVDKMYELEQKNKEKLQKIEELKSEKEYEIRKIQSETSIKIRPIEEKYNLKRKQLDSVIQPKIQKNNEQIDTIRKTIIQEQYGVPQNDA